MTTMTAELVATLTDRVSAQARNIERSLDLMEKQSRRSSRGMQKSTGLISGGVNAASAAMLARAGAFAAPAAAIYTASQAYQDFAKNERSLTRTGIKFGVGQKEMEALSYQKRQIADDYATTNALVNESLDALAEAGFDLPDAQKELSTVVKAAQGLGSSGTDAVNTWDAARKSLGVASQDAEKFFDIVAAGGKAGKFESSDLARYLPSLLPVVSRQGYEGLDGARRLVAFLETMRDFVGSSEEAATATADIFEKISSPDVIKNYKKLGIDLEKELGKARDNGEDVLMVLADITRKAIDGDMTQISKLFGDRDSRRAITVLLNGDDEVRRKLQVLENEAPGTINANVKLLTQDAQAQLDRMSNNWEQLKKSLGAGVSVVVTPMLEGVNDALSYKDQIKRGIEGERKPWEDPQDVRKRGREQIREAYPDLPDIAYYPDGAVDKMLNEALAAKARGEFETMVAAIKAQVEKTGPKGPDLGVASGTAKPLDRTEMVQAPEPGPETGNLGTSTGDVAAPRSRPSEQEMADYRNRTKNDRGGAYMEMPPLNALQSGPEVSRYEPNSLPFKPDGSPDVAEYWKRRKNWEREKGTAPKTADDPYFSIPRAGIYVGPYTGNPESQERADRRREEIKRRGTTTLPGEPTSPWSSHQVDPGRFGDGENALPSIDGLKASLDALTSAMQARAGAEPATPANGALPPAIESAPSVPIPTPRPNIAAPVEEEVSRAEARAQRGGQSIVASLSVTARPVIDTSSLDALITKTRTATRELSRLQTAANAAGAARMAANVDRSGLHANTSRAG